jgi:Bacterial PH domain
VPFSASYDRTTKIISGVVCFGLLAVALAVRNPILALLALLILLASFAWSPRGYAIEGHALLIRRLVGSVRIPLEEIRQVRKASSDDLANSIRLGGSGGLFGYYGLFSNARLGKSTWYMTNRGNAVVVITAQKTVLVSPDDPAGFLAALQAAAPRSSSPGSSPAPVMRRRFSPRWILFGAAIVLAGLGVAANRYSPGPPSYTLTAGSLTIHDRFYPVTLQAGAVDLGGIRIVNLSQNTEWRPVRRTNGFANAHYQSGWFQTAGGEKVRLYRAGSPIVVLLPPVGNASPLLYQAQDPEDFVRQLRAEWGAPAARGAKAGQ